MASVVATFNPTNHPVPCLVNIGKNNFYGESNAGSYIDVAEQDLSGHPKDRFGEISVWETLILSLQVVTKVKIQEKSYIVPNSTMRKYCRRGFI